MLRPLRKLHIEMLLSELLSECLGLSFAGLLCSVWLLGCSGMWEILMLCNLALRY